MTDPTMRPRIDTLETAPPRYDYQPPDTGEVFGANMPAAAANVDDHAPQAAAAAVVPERRRVLTRAQILEADDWRSDWVPLPEWAPAGDPEPETFGAYVRAITATERARWLDASVQLVGKQAKTNFLGATMSLVMAATIDGPDRGAKPLFSKSDLIALQAKNSAPLERLSDAISALSGIGEETKTLLGKGASDPVDSSPTD